MRWLIATILSLSASAAFAGAQIYEPLSASVRAALHKSVSDVRPSSSSFDNPMDAVEWLAEMSPRLEMRIPNRDYRMDLLRSVHYEAKRAGLDPQLVLGLMQVSSALPSQSPRRWVRAASEPTASPLDSSSRT